MADKQVERVIKEAVIELSFNTLLRKSTFDKQSISLPHSTLSNWSIDTGHHHSTNLCTTSRTYSKLVQRQHLLCRIWEQNSTHNTLHHHEAVGTLLGWLALWLLIW